MGKKQFSEKKLDYYALEIGHKCVDDHGDSDYRSETYTVYHPLERKYCIIYGGKLKGYLYGGCELSLPGSPKMRVSRDTEYISDYHTYEETTDARIVRVSSDGCYYSDGKLVYCRRGIEGCCAPKGQFQTIASYAFANCTKLTEVILPEGVVYIERSAFRNCSSLKKLNIPSTVWHLGADAFEGCVSLTDIDLSQNQKLSPTETAFRDTPFINK